MGRPVMPNFDFNSKRNLDKYYFGHIELPSSMQSFPSLCFKLKTGLIGLANIELFSNLLYSKRIMKIQIRNHRVDKIDDNC